MSNVTKKAILRALVEGVLTDLMVQTKADNVYLDDTTTVAAKLAEMVTAINERAKSTDVTTQISAAINGLINGAPATYDTLKEIADYITTHQEAADALTAAVGNKADKTTVEAIQATVDVLGALASKDKVAETDLDDTLKAKVNAAAQGNHSHSNKAVLDGITAEKVAGWDGKGTVYVQAVQPSGLAAGDLWIQTLD